MKSILASLQAALIGFFFAVPTADVEQVKSDAAGAIAYAAIVRDTPRPIPTPAPKRQATVAIAAAEVTESPAAVASPIFVPAPAATAASLAQVAPPASLPPVYRPTYRIQSVPPGWSTWSSHSYGVRRLRSR